LRKQLLFFGLSASILAAADQITLRDGRLLECVVQKETQTSIRIAVESGTMTFPKKLVTRIQRAEPIENEALETRWNQTIAQREAFDAGPHGEWTRRFEALCRERHSALTKKQQTSGGFYEKKQLEMRIQTLIEDTAQLSTKLAGLQRDFEAITLPTLKSSQKRHVEEYNRILSKKNALQDQTLSTFSTLRQKQTQIESARQAIQIIHRKQQCSAEIIAHYTQTLRTFSLALLNFEKKPNSPEAQDLYERIHQKLTAFRKEVAPSEIITRKEGNSLLVSAVVNGISAGEFVFDTGATSMLIHTSFAEKLGVATEELPLIKVVVAGGAIIQGKRIVLKSVQAGNEIVCDVPAVVIPDPPNEANDGLLGMSFLRHFSIHFQGDHGTIELLRLDR